MSELGKMKEGCDCDVNLYLVSKSERDWIQTDCRLDCGNLCLQKSEDRSLKQQGMELGSDSQY